MLVNIERQTTYKFLNLDHAIRCPMDRHRVAQIVAAEKLLK